MTTFTPEQYAARLVLIKEVAAKRKKRADFHKKMEAGAARVRRYTDEVEKPARKARADKFDASIALMDENHNQYTDAPKYVEEHYGDRFRDQQSYESHEGWN